eukprot:TRINITY_DN63_c0_g2_i2.p1 TRINITY_DN63_c0_g2~~TRINITY_DN63_c0_g2_i2.p1  ORF type:complete len:198 (+),score=31.48 TRINITY_DN63_c0_g2_i2:40-633(+)
MGPTTRSVTTKNTLFLENIQPTKDRKQVKFTAEQKFIPTWRAVLHSRYVESVKSKTATTHWQDHNNTNNLISSLPAYIIPPFPSELYKTFIQLTLDSRKLLTITIWYRTGTILIQGHTCQEWLDAEFQQLQHMVHYVHCESGADSCSPASPLPVCQTDDVAVPLAITLPPKQDTTPHVLCVDTVSYTHLTLPTIYSV